MIFDIPSVWPPEKKEPTPLLLSGLADSVKSWLYIRFIGSMYEWPASSSPLAFSKEAIASFEREPLTSRS